MATKKTAQAPAEADVDTKVLDRVQITNQSVSHQFTYHPPDAEQQGQHERIRKACMACAQIIKDNTPNCADQTAAIRKISEGMMTANKAIACRGR